MLVIGLILGTLGIGFLCWLLFSLAVYALPFYAGLLAGFAAYYGGAGVLGAITVGFLAGAATLLIGQLVFASVPSPLVRVIVALVFATPAAIAGFYMALGFSRIGAASPVWSDIFAVVGAICVGCTAFVRMAAMAGPGAIARRGSPASAPTLGATPGPG